MAKLERDYAYDPVLRVFAVLSTVILLVIFAWAVVATSRGPSTRERLDLIEDQNHFIVCLLLIEPEDRIPEAVAGCQASASEE